VNVICVQDILDSTGAVLLRGDAKTLVHGVSTDTRALRPRELFLALHGPNFDGNQFAFQAGRMGAGALLLRGAPDIALPAASAEMPGDLPIAVHDTPRRALSDLASWHRSRLDVPVIGVTGSCGKTTTKNILAQLLAVRLRTVSSPSSFNNDVGVPHTVLLADRDTQALVVEIGTNHPGEIASLCRVARPTGGIITNVGASHLEGLGSVEGVAREKSDLFASLPADGFAVLNLDCRYAHVLRNAAHARVITISVEGSGEGEGDFNATNPIFHSGGTTFRLQGREVTSPLLGIHNISNLLAAIAACHGVGIELDELLPAISRLQGSQRRMQRRELREMVLLDDTYNANPESARAAVRVLSGLHGEGRRVLVLGDMLELGASAPELHHAIGRDAAEAGIDLLVLVGELTRATAAGALEAGMRPTRVVHIESTELAVQQIDDLLAPSDTVLVKGSRRMGLERVVEHLVELHGKARG
jgi:UDP-N-acetylmuramoyl-tripeptide--D-alanyl-D-alanine ligase